MVTTLATLVLPTAWFANVRVVGATVTFCANTLALAHIITSATIRIRENRGEIDENVDAVTAATRMETLADRG
jgi:hypothetical protein